MRKDYIQSRTTKEFQSWDVEEQAGIFMLPVNWAVSLGFAQG